MAKNEKEFLKESRDKLKACIDSEEAQRTKMLDDLCFCTLEQWDSAIRRERENDPNGARPCLTIDKINQYIVQVVNDMRQNRPGIKVRPVDDDADPETAKMLQGLTRHIEDRSSAAIAYETAGESAVKVGLGYFRVVTERVNSAMNEQEIIIRRIPDPFKVYLGPHEMPDGSDAEYGFIFDDIPLAEFKRQYPKASTNSDNFDGLGETTAWLTEKTIRVVEYFYTVRESKEGASEDDYETSKKIRWCKHSAIEVLEERDWAGSFIPIVEVVGRETFVKGERVLWGLVRPAKDSLRMNNYWMSAITEKIGLAPKAPFIAAEGQIEGREAEWKGANRENRAVLQYKAIDINGTPIQAPQRVAPAAVEAAMIQMTALIERDVKASLGMYKAAVGDTDPQQSGRAILALQRESDTATFHFIDNLSRSIRHCGRIVIDLIPKIYDTRRVVRILGEDGEPAVATIDPNAKAAYQQIETQGGIRQIFNPSVGIYDVTVTTGPSYNTRRMEAAEAMLKITEGKPEVLQIMGDLMFKALDWPMADEIAKRFKKLLPPALQEQEGQPPIPPQVAQQMQQMQAMLQQAGQRIQELESGEKPAMAKIAVQAKEAEAKHELAVKEAVNEDEYNRWKAKLEAETKVVIAQIAAKQSNDEALVKAENEANIAFMQGVNDRGIADADRDANMELEASKQNSESEGGEQKGGTPALPPVGGLREVMGNMAQMLSQMAQQNQMMMQQHEQSMMAMMQMMSKPKQVALQRDSTGRPVGATVQ